ncbi:alpha/beta fold hydrolase [Nocardia alni]|uniref:alpha/beta fold hydrolase n=1 Tax=Nocardia alni TaxID=2815723 RepID=UPI001C2249D4|nr:alpha/beta fold hydrolase [Nocardia alni]
MRKLTTAVRSLVFGAAPISRERALAVSERLAAATTVTSSLEHLVIRDKFGAGGVNDWNIVRQTTLGRGAIERRILEAVSTERRTVALHCARVVVGVCILLPGQGRWRGYGNAFLALGTIVLSPRHRYGSDGSDQVATITHAVAATARLSRTTEASDAALWYGSIQAALAYCVPGTLKLLGEQWRGGSALSGIMRTRAYGHPGLYAVMRRHPRATRYLSHATVAWECAFPLIFAARGRLTRPVLATGLGFHLVNGVTMGLGRFLTAFPSMYPMLAYTTTPRTHHAVADRDDRVVRVALGAVLAAGAVAGTLAVRKRLEVLDGWPKSKTMTTRCGNRLQYKAVGDWDEGSPVVVLLSDRAETPEHFSWLIDRLAETSGCGVLSYSRAGYGASRRYARARFELSEAAGDLADLLAEAVPPDRRIVLAGHGFGGILARSAAQSLPGRIDTVAYIDPIHTPCPDVDPADEAREDAETRQVLWSLRAGLGVLVNRPRWLDSLPSPNQRQVFAQWSDARMWRATAREMRVLREWAEPTAGQAVGHALVITSQQSLDQSPERAARDADLLDAHRRAGFRGESAVLAHADRQGLLTNQRFAVQVADRILEFLAAANPPAEQRHGGSGWWPTVAEPIESMRGGQK